MLIQFVTIPRQAVPSPDVGTVLRDGVLNHLGEFCRQQLLKLKYVTSNFKHKLNFRGSVAAIYRDWSKLSKILERILFQQAPYLHHALANNGLVEINRANMALTAYVSAHDVPILNRYARYLNYLMRKSGLPVLLTLSSQTDTLPSGAVLMAVKLGLRSVCVAPADFPIALPSVDDFKTYAEWLDAARVECGSRGVNPDKIFSVEGIWSIQSIDRLNAGSVHIYDASSPMPPERIFLYLPEILAAAKTFSRKFRYATDAYRISTE